MLDDDEAFIHDWYRRWLGGLTVTDLTRGTVSLPVLRGAIHRLRKRGYGLPEIAAVMREAQAVAFRPDPARTKELEGVLSDLAATSEAALPT